MVKSAVRVAWPLFALPYFLVKCLYKCFFAWWLDPWLTERNRRRLLSDIADEMSFLGSKGRVVKRKKSSQPFDYASVYLDLESIRICITRGRGEVAVSFASHACLDDWYRLGAVLEALGVAQNAIEQPLCELRDVDRVLEHHWKSIKAGFSGDHYPGFKAALSEIRCDDRKAALEAQWQLAKHLGRLRR
jgi:hypothetical protein